MSHEKTLLLSIEPWLVNRDPYIVMVYYNPHIDWVVYFRTNPKQLPGAPFFIAQMFLQHLSVLVHHDHHWYLTTSCLTKSVEALEWKVGKGFLSHRIHGTGIFTYIWLMFIVNVGCR